MSAIMWLAKDIGTIEGLLSGVECDEHIRFSEDRRYEQARVSTDRGAVMMRDLRNNDRVMLDDPALAARFYGPLAGLLPQRFKEIWQPVGLNERLRFYRYDEGQIFDWHSDGYFERQNGERSFFTFMVYLNDDFEGGGTSSRGHGIGQVQPGQITVRPRKGMGLIFHHPIDHRGDRIISGRKYVFRTDIMYERV